MAKATISTGYDIKGVKYYKLEKKKGVISQQEAYEAMESEGYFGEYLLYFPVPEDVPFDLYDPGDCWMLYKIGDMLGEKAEEEYNKGYDACLKDYQFVDGVIKQGIDNCYLIHQFGHPGWKYDRCAGHNVSKSEGRLCEPCRGCRLHYGFDLEAI